MTQYCTQYYNDENGMYRQTSNMSRTKSQNSNCFSSRLSIVLAQSIEARCYVETEDVVRAAPTGAAPATPEWSTILLHTKVRLILELLWYIFL